MKLKINTKMFWILFIESNEESDTMVIVQSSNFTSSPIKALSSSHYRCTSDKQRNDKDAAAIKKKLIMVEAKDCGRFQQVSNVCILFIFMFLIIDLLPI